MSTQFDNVSVVAPAIGLAVPTPVYHCIVKSVAAGATPSTSMVIEPFAGAPEQFVLSINVFCVITGVTLTSCIVNCTSGDAQLDAVFVAFTK